MLKHEFLLIGGNDDSQLTAGLDDFRWPAKEILPILASRFLEDLLTVSPDDGFEPVSRSGVLRISEKRDDVSSVGREVNVFHSTRSDDLVDVLNCRSIRRLEADCIRHRQPSISRRIMEEGS